MHFEAVIIGVNGLIQPKTVNQFKLQHGGCIQAVVGLYIFAVWHFSTIAGFATILTLHFSRQATKKELLAIINQIVTVQI